MFNRKFLVTLFVGLSFLLLTPVCAVYSMGKNMTDGESAMNKIQALQIAQTTLKNEGNNEFEGDSYKFLTGEKVESYPGYWFIVFPQQSTKSLINSKFIVVVSKNNNEVYYSGKWFPGKQADFDWIFKGNRSETLEENMKKTEEVIQKLKKETHNGK